MKPSAIETATCSDWIKSLREKLISHVSKRRPPDLNKPVGFWTKEDRLKKGIGKELTIILRTRGCSWALGESGGCSMCGYVGDYKIKAVYTQEIMNQYDDALYKTLEEIEKDEND